MLRAIPLPVQVEMIFQDLQDELCGLSAGTVFLQIRNEKVDQYGVRHRMECRKERQGDGHYPLGSVSPEQAALFKDMAAELVGRKHGSWSMGTISYKFSIKRGVLSVSVHFADLDGDCLVE